MTTKETPKGFVVIDKAATGIPQFPSTANQAQKNLQEYLNGQKENGLFFHSQIQQYVGAELRTFFVFLES